MVKSAVLLLLSAAFASCATLVMKSVADLDAHKVKLAPAQYKGRAAVLLKRDSEGEGLAFLHGAEFGDGTIDADVAVKLTTRPGERNPGFIGIAFRARPDAIHYDLVYIRPGNSHAEDQAMRNHTVQYVAPPSHDWYRLRREWPWVFESSADLQLESWIHLRIEVEGRRARVFLNNAANPSLVVNGIMGEDLKGGVGLWGSAGQESYFANVKVTSGKPQTVQNGGEASGAWDLKFNSDAGPYACVLQLRRDGDQVSGTLAGLLAGEVPVTGTWRNGYVELSFHGAWQGNRDPGEAQVDLEGWVDGNSADGRMNVHGRADGVWTATRKQ